MTPARRSAEEFATAVDGDASGPTGRSREVADLLGVVSVLRAQAPVAPREFTRDLRDRLMAEAESLLTPANAALTLPTRTRGTRERRIAVAASVAVLVGGTATMATAAQSALPGDTLYPVKRGIELADAGLSLSPGGKGRDLLDQANDRLTEVEGLLASDSFQSEPRVPAPSPSSAALPTRARLCSSSPSARRATPTTSSPCARSPPTASRSSAPSPAPSAGGRGRGHRGGPGPARHRRRGERALRHLWRRPSRPPAARHPARPRRGRPRSPARVVGRARQRPPGGGPQRSCDRQPRWQRRRLGLAAGCRDGRRSRVLHRRDGPRARRRTATGSPACCPTPGTCSPGHHHRERARRDRRRHDGRLRDDRGPR